MCITEVNTLPGADKVVLLANYFVTTQVILSVFHLAEAAVERSVSG